MSGSERLTNVEKVTYRCLCGQSHTEFLGRTDRRETTRARVKSAYCHNCEQEADRELYIIFHELRGRTFRPQDTDKDRGGAQDVD